MSLFQRAVLTGGLLLILQGTAIAQEQWEWTTNDAGNIVITSYRLGESQVTVPASITGRMVTEIGSWAFYRNGNVAQVTLPATLQKIGYCAFNSCRALTSINFPEGLTHIDTYAFEATDLITVTLPSTLEGVGEAAFMQCDRLVAIEVAAANPNLTSLDGVLFNKAATTLLAYPGGKMGPYTVPASTTEIATRAFQYSKRITGVTLAEASRTVNYYAFYGCENLTTAELNEGLLSLGDQAFALCKSLGSIRIPTTVASIGNLCFLDCINLETLTLPQGLTTVGGMWVFQGCTKLTSVAIPGSVQEAGYGTFNWCTNLHTATIAPGVNKLTATFTDCWNLRNVSIPDSCSDINERVFHGCRSLSQVSLPNTVTNIGTSAFQGCLSLGSIAIPATTQALGDRAFEGCRALATVTVPTNVVSAGNSCFENCDALTTLNLPASVQDLGSKVAYNCRSLNAINVAPGNLWYRSIDGVLYDSEATRLIQYATGRSGPFQVPSSVTVIEYEAFRGAAALTAITTWGENLQTIRDSAFAECTGLTTITVPATLIHLGEQAFARCTNLLGILFEGNAIPLNSSFTLESPEARLYFRPGTTGWDNLPTGIVATSWNGELDTRAGSYGPMPEGFQVTVTGEEDMPVGIEACTSLEDPTWVAVGTTRIQNGTGRVIDPNWQTQARRFYRCTWPQ